MNLPETIDIAISETIESFGQIDVLVNNAGYALMRPIEGVTTEQLERRFQTNLFGLVSTIQAVLPIMRQQGGGTITRHFARSILAIASLMDNDWRKKVN